MPTSYTHEQLAQIPLFQGVEPADLARISQLLYSSIFPAGASIMSLEQSGDAAYIIQSGTVKIHREQPDGNDVILAILGPGEVLGEMSMIDSLDRSASVTSLEESMLLWMHREAFWQCLHSIPAICFNLLAILSRRVRLANTHIETLASLDVPGRIASQILAFGREYGERTAQGELVIPIRLTQSDLANLVGASRVRVNQTLVDFKRQGLISVSQNFRITIHDHAALESYCS